MKKNAKLTVLTVLMGLTSLFTVSGQTNLSDLTDANGNFSASMVAGDPANVTTLTQGEYIMDKRVYVGDGHELYIEAGTIIKATKNHETYGTTDSACALVVTRGGKIFANGTANAPIIFTSIEDDLDGTYSLKNKEKWGGVMILGKARNNIIKGDGNPEQPGTLLGFADGVGYIEGLPYPDPRHHYGAVDTLADGTPVFDDNDNSGVLKYVSIRHGGTDIGEANEINGLTLGSVGKGTTIEHIEVVANGDDGIEFFGGSVDAKYVNIMFCEDDYLDWDQGWNGRVQFMYGVQLPQQVEAACSDTLMLGDNGMECDGDDGEDAARPFLSNPQIFNATIIGNGSDDGLELKERTQGYVANCILANFKNGVDIEQDGEDKGQAGVDFPGAMQIKNNLFLNNTNCADNQQADILSEGNLCVTATDIIDDEIGIEIDQCGDADDIVNNPVNPIPAPGHPEIETDVLPDFSDGFFDYAPYKGAFEPGTESWLKGWTLHAQLQTTITGCPTDVNGDRATDASDLNELISNFGSSCE
jgi:hypothetical protein